MAADSPHLPDGANVTRAGIKIPLLGASLKGGQNETMQMAHFVGLFTIEFFARSGRAGPRFNKAACCARQVGAANQSAAPLTWLEPGPAAISNSGIIGGIKHNLVRTHIRL